MEKSAKHNNFVEYTYWLSESRRNPRVKASRPSRVLKGSQVVINDNKYNSKPLKKHSHEPLVQFEEENGIVKNVEITCSCGEKLKIALDYDSDNNSEK